MTTAPHCCAELKCIDRHEAKDLRDMLNVLNVKVADGYGYEFRKEAGETRIERIGYAIERIRQYDGIFLDLEDLDGRLQEIARAIPVCDLNAVCAKC